MKSLLLLPLLLLGVNAQTLYTECYTGPNLSGYYVYFNNYAPDLYSNGIDNDIESVRQTGMWMYYENYDYNVAEAGLVYFVHGIDIAVNFPVDYANVMSSLRFAGSLYTLNADTITFYEGTSFTGVEYYTEYDTTSLDLLAGKVSSIIVTGSSPWTIYTGEDFTGYYWCVYGTDSDTGSNGEVLDLGIFPSMENEGVPDNSIMSVRKGCWGERVLQAPELKVDGRHENGAWGRLQ